MKQDNNHMIMLYVISIIALLIAMIGATFAYFTANIKYKKVEEDTFMKSEVLEVIFNTKNEIVYKNILPGRQTNESKNKFTFSVSSNDDSIVKIPYDIYFVIAENTFEKNNNNYSNLVFLLNGVAGKSKQKIYDNDGNLIVTNSVIANTCDNEYICGNGQYYDNENYLIKTLDNNTKPTKIGRIEALKTGKIKIGSGVLGAYGSTDEWTFELWLDETSNNQNYDNDKVLKGYIEINANDTTLYNN